MESSIREARGCNREKRGECRRMCANVTLYKSCIRDILTDMIIDNDPIVTRSISVPRELSQLSCSSFTAGIVEAVLDGLGFVCSTA